MTDRITPSPTTARIPETPAQLREGERHGPGPIGGATTAGPSFGEVLQGAVSSIAEGQSRIDRAVRRGARGETDPGKLLALQAGVYRYTQELELASKLVDKATSALKTTLQSQQ